MTAWIAPLARKSLPTSIRWRLLRERSRGEKLRGGNHGKCCGRKRCHPFGRVRSYPDTRVVGREGRTPSVGPALAGSGESGQAKIPCIGLAGGSAPGMPGRWCARATLTSWLATKLQSSNVPVVPAPAAWSPGGLRGPTTTKPVTPGGEIMKNEQARQAWVRPTIIRKPVSETLQGNGHNQDGIGGEFPIQS